MVVAAFTLAANILALVLLWVANARAYVTGYVTRFLDWFMNFLGMNKLAVWMFRKLDERTKRKPDPEGVTTSRCSLSLLL